MAEGWVDLAGEQAKKDRKSKRDREYPALSYVSRLFIEGEHWTQDQRIVLGRLEKLANELFKERSKAGKKKSPQKSSPLPTARGKSAPVSR